MRDVTPSRLRGGAWLLCAVTACSTSPSAPADVAAVDESVVDDRGAPADAPTDDVATPTDVPVTTDVPVSVDAQPAMDVPVTVDVPVTTDVPMTVDVPTIVDVPVLVDRPDAVVAVDRPVVDVPAVIDRPAVDVVDVPAVIDRPVVDVPAVDVPTVDAGRIVPGDPGAADVRFTVDSSRNAHAISRYIYGYNSPDWTRARGVTFTRIGGNRLTAYNWENNASNAGSDYMFQNDNYLCGSAGCDRPGETIRRGVADSFAHGASIAVTVPMAGYVSADTRGGGDVRASGADYLRTRFRVSVPHKTTAFTLTPDLTDANVYQDEFANWLEHTFPRATDASAPRVFYELDNEPDLWSSTHAEVHPAAARYDEMVRRSTELATALKAVAPGALVFGPVSYGWNGYVTLQDAPDAMGRDFIETYLDGMRAAETTAGRRLLDVLDLHWYPEAQGGGQRIDADAAGTAIAAARVQAGRSLWDPTYTETSWITMWSTMGPIRLLPRMAEKIRAHYPGTRVAFTEYYYGGGADITGGIAEADVLGAFGREDVFAASVWHEGSTDDRYIYAAIRMFRDVDGMGAGFGDTSVSATCSDDARAAVYASVLADGRTVALVAINRGTAATTAGLTVAHGAALTQAEVWQLTSASATPTRVANLTAVARNAFRYTMPARSVSTLFVRP